MVEEPSLAARVANFLLRAVDDPDFERDTPVAAALELVLQAEMAMGGGPALLGAVVDDIDRDAAFWVKAVEHAKRLDRPETRGVGSVARALVLHLLRGRPALRRPFFFAEKPRMVQWVVEEALSDLDLEVPDLAALLALAGGIRASVLTEWGRRHAGTAREMVESWLADQPDVRKLPPAALAPLMEAVARTAADNVWRDGVLGALEQRPDETSWRVVVELAAFGWAAPEPPASERHRALLQRVARAPTRLADTGLTALRRDVHLHPLAVFDSTLAVMDLVDGTPPETRERELFAGLALDNLSLAFDQAHKQSLPAPPVDRLIGLMSEVSPRLPGSPLDHSFTSLFERHPEQAEDALRRWLSRHAVLILSGDQGFAELVPLLASKAGPIKEAEWFLRWLCDRDPRLRHVAAKFVSLAGLKEFPKQSVARCSEDEVRAVTHQLLGDGVRGESLVPLLLALLDARPDLSSFFGELLGGEVVDLYPGTCREHLQSRQRGGAAPPPAAVAEVEARLDLALQARVDAAQRRAAVPELRVTSPGLFEASQLEARVMRSATRLGRSRSVLAQLALQVTIIEGEASMDFGSNTTSTRFQRFTFSAEMPNSALADPVGAQLRQVTHLQTASELLAPEAVP